MQVNILGIYERQEFWSVIEFRRIGREADVRRIWSRIMGHPDYSQNEQYIRCDFWIWHILDAK